MRPRLLDLFCGGGGSGMGYSLAGGCRGYDPRTYRADKGRLKHRIVCITGNTAQRRVVHNERKETFGVSDCRVAMGMPWATMKELSQAIPPAYTQWIGERLMEAV